MINSYYKNLIFTVIVLILLTAGLTAMFCHSRTITRQQYLQRIYPLLKPSQATDTLFNSLNFYQSPYPNLHRGIEFKHDKYQPPKLGELTCLYWTDCKFHKLFSNHKSFYFITGISGDVFKNDYDPKNFNNYPLKRGYPSYSYIEVYHNLWYPEPGHYLYRFRGTGIFLNVGKTLVANNKVDALLKLGFTEQEIFNIDTKFENRFNQPVGIYAFVKNYAEKHHLRFKRAVKYIIDQAAYGANYEINRIANSDNYDNHLWMAGKKQGFDTIQMTIQPNGTAGWGYEVLDLRSDNNQTLEQQWHYMQHFLSIRNPVDLQQSKPCTFKTPFKQLYCEQLQHH